MSYRTPDRGAHSIVKGVDTAITQRFMLEDETSPTVTLVQAVVYDEAGAVVETYTGTWAEPTASVTVLATDTTGLTLPDTSWAVVWKLTIGGVVVESRRAAFLVPRLVYASVISTDLTTAYGELADIATTTEMQEAITTAWADVVADLEARGFSVHWSSNPGQLGALLEVKAAGMLFRDAASDQQDTNWAAEARRLIGDDGISGIYGDRLARPLSVDKGEDKVEDTAPEHLANVDDFMMRRRVG